MGLHHLPHLLHLGHAMARDKVNKSSLQVLFFPQRLIERTRARIVDSKPDEITIEPLPIECKMKVFQS